MSDDTDRARSILRWSDHRPIPAEKVTLNDRSSLALCIGPDGTPSLWLMDDVECDCDYCVDTDLHTGSLRHARHEQLGPLPIPYPHRIAEAFAPRCGRPRKSDGKPCRGRVARDGDACSNHRGQVHR